MEKFSRIPREALAERVTWSQEVNGPEAIFRGLNFTPQSVIEENLVAGELSLEKK